jgi:hypothetical protein
VSKYQSSWQKTERLLLEAKALLSPEVAAVNAADLRQFDEFLEANELGLAFDWLKSIAYEGMPNCLPLLCLLSAASEEMNLHECLTELNNRIRTLAQQPDG